MSVDSIQPIVLYTLPLWLPLLGLVLYLLVALCNLCIDGLVFLVEIYLGRVLRPSTTARLLLAAPALAIYPITVTLEMGFFFLVYLGSIPLSRLQAFLGKEISQSASIRFVAGALWPIWLLPALLYALIQFYLFTLRVLLEIRRPKTARNLLRRGSGTFEAFVGLRYLKARKNQSFISAITLISVAGVMVGVCALVVVLSVMSGFEEDLKAKILGTNSHAIILKYGGDVTDYRDVMTRAREIPGVIAATPFIYSEVMLSADSSGSGVIIKGIDAHTVGDVTDLINSMREGIQGALTSPQARKATIESLDDVLSTDPRHAGLPGLIVGEELARTLHIIPTDLVTVVSPLGEIGPMGTRTPKYKRFIVAGVFKSGMYEYDAKFTYTSLKAAQDFFSMGDAVTGVELKVDDIYQAREIAKTVETRLGYPYWTRDWMSMNKNLFSALYLEKIVMGIILGMIVLVAALNIISTLIMVVIEKGKEIAILKAMGATGNQIMKVFMIEGLIIGFIGTTLGLLLGFGLCFILDRTELIHLNPDVYYLDTLPVEISLPMFGAVALAALTISFVATLYPSWQASRQDPVEGLRYE